MGAKCFQLYSLPDIGTYELDAKLAILLTTQFNNKTNLLELSNEGKYRTEPKKAPLTGRAFLSGARTEFAGKRTII